MTAHDEMTHTAAHHRAGTDTRLCCLQDFELQDEGLQVLAKVIIIYDLSFIILGTLVYHAILMSYVRAPRVC